MRLAAVYLPENSIPYVFGEGHKGQTLNLGGKFEYSFEENKNSIILTKKELSENFIDSFWGEDISLVTSIVGRNGVGKTSFLRAINHSPDPKHIDSLLIFEYPNSESIGLLNETKKEFKTGNNKEIKVTERDFERQYYSPLLDYDLVDTLSSIALVNYNEDRLEDYFLDSITRNALLLSDPVIDVLKEVYDDFPYYDQYLIGAKKNRKSHFREVYLEANLGNPNRGDVLINELNGEILKLENLKLPREYDQNDLIEIYKRNIGFLKSESFTSLFDDIWSLPEYKCSNDYNYIHNTDDFIKNLEVTILSYLILGAVFPQTGLGEGKTFDFNKILNSQNFSERLNKLLAWYLISEYRDLYNSVKDKVTPFLISEKDKIIDLIKKDKLSYRPGVVDNDQVKERMIRHVEMFSTIKGFYDLVIKMELEKKLVLHKGQLVFDFKNNKLETFNELVDKYKSLLAVFNHIPTNVAILEFVPSKKLSSGEKALIDFYASLNTYIDNMKNEKHKCLENYILLLDEPELGYHPLWKRKFVQAIVKTLPVLFSKIDPLKYDDKSKKYVKSQKPIPNIQIIFSTHDPLTLSDIPKNNIIYLDKNNEGLAYIVNQNNTPKKSFGANITDLLADSFFVKDGLIGDFAKERIDEVINKLNYKILLQEIVYLENKNRVKDKSVNPKVILNKISEAQELDKITSHIIQEYCRSIINIVDEPLLKNTLETMYDQAFAKQTTKDKAKQEIEDIARRSGLDITFNEGE